MALIYVYLRPTLRGAAKAQAWASARCESQEERMLRVPASACLACWPRCRTEAPYIQTLALSRQRNTSVVL